MDLKIPIKALEEQVQKLFEELNAERINRKALEDKIEAFDSKLPDLASTLEEIQRRNAEAEAKPKPDANLIESDGFEERSITKGNPKPLPFTGKKDCCPWCSERAKPSLLDLTTSGRWACRQCGKHWYEEHLGQKYSKQLEKFIKVNDQDKDPMEAIFGKSQADRDSEVTDLKKQVEELKLILIRSSLNGNGKSA